MARKLPVLKRVLGAPALFSVAYGEVASSIYSLSSSAPHLFGARLAEFDAELRALLTGASAGGAFSEQMRSITLSVWR